ncbi:MAG: LamG domain-containing protein [Candidatus Levybacteria bacterium]|nr:LamG domain-containing protein [Candidatus Levybacteria bacterium]
MKKLFLSPLLILIIIIVAGVSLAGASLLIGTTREGETNSQSIDLQRGLVGWWKMDGNANDSTSSANDGTVSGATLVNDRKSEALKAYSFDGSGDYIRMGNVLNQPTNDFSISAWVKSTYNAGGGGNRNGIVYKKPTVQLYSTGYRLNMPDGNFVLSIADGTTDNTLTTSPTDAYNDGNWHHVVGVVKRGVELRIYVDGSSAGSTPSTLETSISGSNIFEIGGETTTAQLFTGQIDDVRIYNRALSATEVTALHQEYDPGIQISNLQKGLIGWWKMDGDAKDVTPNSNNGTVTGAVLTTDRKGQANKAYSFDGDDDITVADATPLHTTQAITVSWWAKTESISESHTMISKFTTTGNQRMFLAGMSADNPTNFRVAVYPAGTVTPIKNYRVDENISDGVWRQFAFTFEAGSPDGTLKLYINGVEKTVVETTDDAVPSLFDSTSPVRIGAHEVAGSLTSLFVGSIDDVRIYNRALSSVEITALYDSYNPSVQISNLQKGLVGYWALDGDAKDRTPYGNNGTLRGDAAVTANDRKGQINKALNLDGTGDSVLMSYNTAYNAPTNLSVSAWIRQNSTSGRQIVASIWRFTAGCGNKAWTFYNDGGTVKVQVCPVDTVVTLNGPTVSSETWTHVVFTYDGSNVRFYKDGSLTHTRPQTGNLATDPESNLRFGAEDTDSGNNLNGLMDDVRIYNRALSSTEVTALYQSY